jgi:hypothetical protein
MRPLLFSTVLVPVLAASLVACASSSTPRSRVAEDLGCTTRGTGVRKLAANTPRPGLTRWEVVGCGKQAIYVCTTPVRDCWREGQIHEHRTSPDGVPPIP